MKTPTSYDTIAYGDKEEKVVNQEATFAAREKQKLIKERFKSWIFSDPDRAERLVRIYNDTYNNLRPRLFDGSHLEFPGYEIHGMKRLPAPGQEEEPVGRVINDCEQVSDSEAEFWSLFGHIPGQGLDCIGDFTTREHAEEILARITGRLYKSLPRRNR
jgi:hypothetical protein